MTGRINTFRTAVTAHFRAKFPAVPSIETQFGRFDLDELERTSFKTPSIRVAVLTGKAPSTAAGKMDAALQCAAFVVTDGKQRDEEAWDLAEALAALLHPAQLFGMVQLSAPTGVSIQPVVSGSIRNRGISIIAVEWSQTLRGAGAELFDEDGFLILAFELNGETVDVEAIDGQA